MSTTVTATRREIHLDAIDRNYMFDSRRCGSQILREDLTERPESASANFLLCDKLSAFAEGELSGVGASGYAIH